MERCPVCQGNLENRSICLNCHFDTNSISFTQVDNYNYSENRLVISYRNKWLMSLSEYEFDSSFTVLLKYKGESSTVEVPYGVKLISSAFKGNQRIKSVILPTSVTEIGDDAFSGCINLETVDLPNSIISIGKRSFWGCSKLFLSISTSVRKIEEGSLTQVKNISIQGNSDYFRVQQGMLIDQNNGVLLAAAFQSASMNIIVPNNVKRIGYMAFYGGYIQNSIVLPTGLKSLGGCAMVNAARSAFVIPNTVTIIESGAFASMTNVSLEDGNPYFYQTGNFIVEKATNRLITVCDRSCISVSIPCGIKTIAEYAFAFCQRLNDVIIPNSVEYIESSAFIACKTLKSIVLPQSIKQMGWGVFRMCTALDTIYCGSESIMAKSKIDFWARECNAHIELCTSDMPVQQVCNELSIDKMNGHEFEYFCANLLRKNGFSDVNVTKGSGDQGVDILAKKDGIKYAIQCKNYSSHLGNTPVQEVNAGKIYYNCHVGVVMTNSRFTSGAQKLAQATGVLLWDRSKLLQMIDNAKL